uniref:eIF-4F 25 kDa subunit n=1 Tax=Chenopodium quinoa TaxID=63459 RepID=A0A803MDJ0_CHEQI
MAVEELEKSMAATEIEDKREDDDDLEEGEIIDDNSNAGKPSKSIATTHPLENAWTFCLYNNIRHPSKLAPGADFHCFKNKIEPKWEDPICANGGKWTVTFPRGKSDTSWLYTLLAMIGEQFDHGDEICGAVVNVRARQDKISIWTKNAANESAQLSIGKQWKMFLDYNETMGFIFHDDAKKHDRGAKNRYTC